MTRLELTTIVLAAALAGSVAGFLGCIWGIAQGYVDLDGVDLRARR